MKLMVQQDDAAGIITISAEGSVDTVTAPDLEKCLKKYYEKQKKIVVDFSKVSYVSSAGLRVLLHADSSMGSGNFVLKHVNPDVKEVLSLTGFCEILTILD